MSFRNFLESKIDKDSFYNRYEGEDIIGTQNFLNEPIDSELAFEISSDYVNDLPKSAKKETLQINKLTATQNIVKTDIVKEKMKKVDNTPVEVVEKDGVFYLIDGHHRVAADYYNNKKKVKALVYHIKEEN